jgi:four helix bundle protein
MIAVAGARHYTELIAWQLADAIRLEVFALTERPAFRRDFRLRDQTDDAIASVCRNIAEGFAGSDAEFRHFLIIARMSLNELSDSLRSALLKNYIAQEELGAIAVLSRRLHPALAGLIRHLEWKLAQARNRRPRR